MPEISRFYGIVIKMYWDDHAPPHSPVEYGDHEAAISIRTLGIISGKLPSRVIGMVAEWASLHQDELLVDWHKAGQLEPLQKIAPLP